MSSVITPEIFDRDPFIACPFDRSEMRIVTESGEVRTGALVAFHHVGPGLFFGTVRAIGENAKYEDGDAFTALVIESDGSSYLKTADDVSPIDLEGLDRLEASRLAKELVRTAKSDDEVRKRLTEYGFHGSSAAISSMTAFGGYSALVLVRSPWHGTVSV